MKQHHHLNCKSTHHQGLLLGKNLLQLTVLVVWARVLVVWAKVLVALVKVAQEKGKNQLANHHNKFDRMDNQHLFHWGTLDLVLSRPNLHHTC